MCKDKHGSRVVDAVWRHSEVGRKEGLARELLSHEDELMGNYYGQIVMRNCNIAHYKKKQSVWQEQQKSADKRRKMFQDIIAETGGERGGALADRERRSKKKRKIPLFEVTVLVKSVKSFYVNFFLSRTV